MMRGAMMLGPLVAVALMSLPTSAAEEDALAEYKALLENARKTRASGQAGVKEIARKPVRIATEQRIEEFIKTTIQRTQRLGNLVMMDNTVGKVFPGAFLWSRPVGDGRLHELPRIEGRPAVTVTVSGPLLSQSSCQHEGTFSSFVKCSSPIVQRIMSTPVRMKSDYRVSTTLEDALLNLGLSAKYWVVKVDSSLRKTVGSSRSYAVLALDQVYYSMTTDGSPPGGYLPDELVRRSPDLLQKLVREMPMRGEVAYVRKVDYGRRLIIVLSSQSSVEELKRALSVTVDSLDGGGRLGYDDQTRKVWNSVEGQMILIGGKYPAGINVLFSGNPDSFRRAVQEVMAKENVVYSREQGAVPVSFELAYVSDDAPLQVYETTEFAGKIPQRSWRRLNESFEISTSGEDAAVIHQDAEIDSDDYTKVELVSQVLRLSSDRQEVLFDLVWRAYEGERNRTIRPKTIIESRKTFRFKMPRPIDRFAMGPTSVGAKEQWYAGEVHSHQQFPNHGFLSNIRVRFDGSGRHDDQLQSLNATLRFSVWLEE